MRSTQPHLGRCHLATASTSSAGWVPVRPKGLLLHSPGELGLTLCSRCLQGIHHVNAGRGGSSSFFPSCGNLSPEWILVAGPMLGRASLLFWCPYPPPCSLPHNPNTHYKCSSRLYASQVQKFPAVPLGGGWGKVGIVICTFSLILEESNTYYLVNKYLMN